MTEYNNSNILDHEHPPEQVIPLTVIEPKKGWVPVDLKEIWKYRAFLFQANGADILGTFYKMGDIRCYQ